MNEIEGFEIPIHRSLTEEMLLAGCPRAIVILNGSVFVMLVLILQIWYTIPFNIILHIAAVMVTKKDPQFFECFKRYIHKKNYYST